MGANVSQFFGNAGYIGTYNTSYENGNFGEPGRDSEAEINEFYEIAYGVIEIIKPGPHKDPEYDSLLINFRNSPEPMANTIDGTIVYPQSNNS